MQFYATFIFNYLSVHYTMNIVLASPKFRPMASNYLNINTP